MKKYNKLILMSIVLIYILHFFHNDTEQKILYFYSPYCATCVEAKAKIDTFKKQNKVKIIFYDVSESKNKELLEKLCIKYSIPIHKSGLIPAVFCNNKSLIGQDVLNRDLSILIN